MLNFFDPITEALLAFICITVLSSWFSALGYRHVVTIIDKHGEAYKSASLLIYVLLGPIIGICSTVLLIFPALSGLVIPSHCHDDICSAHAPTVTMDSILGGGLAIVSTVLLITFISLFYFRLRRYKKQLSILDNLSDLSQNNTYKVIDSPALLAWNTGFWRTKIFISKGLISSLSTDELNIIVAHEICHSIHHDNFRKMIIHWLSKIWVINQKKLLNDFEIFCEQTCDLYAVNKVASIEKVINTIKKYEKLAEQNKQVADNNITGKRIELLDCLSVKKIPTKSRCCSISFLVGILFITLFTQIVFFTMVYHLWLDHLLLV